ncbi:MAG TPA: 3-dehydroquinate synthase family protein [Pyrinomonadaceae bacterium]|jgi:3-dehydroquinate synthase
MSDAKGIQLVLPLDSPGTSVTSVVLGEGVLARGCDLLRDHKGVRLLLVSDANVAPLYAAPLREALEGGGYDAHLLEIPAGEEGKSLDTLTRLYEECRALEVERSDVVLAVGGGVVGDVAGMLAGTYLRGLGLIQVPTSLVAMVTASVGGKVGVNFGGYKNLVGLFKQASLVLADTHTLRTLPPVEFRSGLGELVTVGVLGAPEIVEQLEASGTQSLSRLVSAAIECKHSIVRADPFDRLGVRARLNLGHTFGHALERLSGFTLAHGLAVAVGLRLACRLAVRLGLCAEEVSERVRSLLVALDLPTALTGYAPERMLEAMRGDKKRRGGRLQFILPKAIGEVTLVGQEEIPAPLLEEVLRATVWEGAA